MIYFYQFILQVIWILKPFFKYLPHEKVKYFFKNEGQIKKTSRFESHPIWIHASSGEIEYAKPLIREIKKHYPHLSLLVTHTSLSSEKSIRELDVEAWGVAPLDSPQDIKKFLEIWKPRACLIARTDLWPQTILELHRKKIPIYLFSATFSQGSKKISFFSRKILESVLTFITKVYFVSSADQKICQFYFPSLKGEVLGDTRYDQVLFRLREAPPIKIPHADKILIAGSTWEEDEQVIIPAFEKLQKRNWKFILVPHEISASHLNGIRNRMKNTTLKYHFYSQGLKSFSWETCDVLIIDQVGLLASLYSEAHIAFIGGSFKRQVHSVMEALATLSPVVVGPFYLNNREALEFKDLGFVSVVHSTSDFVTTVEKWEAHLIEMKPELLRQIQLRQGTTEKMMKSLKSEGLFD